MVDKADQYVERATELVMKKFPEMAGAEPSLSEKRLHSKCKAENSGSPSQGPESDRYVLTFEKDIPLPEGRSLKRMVRVTMDERGEVVRLTSSK